MPSKEENYLLSVCIPTYNRARFIGEALESVISQYEKSWDGKIEICVSDNASTDDTGNKVLSFRSTSPIPITYSKNEDNEGFDRNLLKAVSLAHGRYCWLLGDDDIIEPGGISKILGILAEKNDLAGVSVKQNGYSQDLKHKIFLRSPLPDQSHVYQDAGAAFRALGFYFGYISGQIINKSLWDCVVDEFPVKNYLNGYIHIYMLGQILRKNPFWMYWATPLVGWRSENERALSDLGRYRRIELDVAGYRDITLALFGPDATYNFVMSQIGTHYIRMHLMTARSQNVGAGFFLKALGLCLKNYWRYPSFWIKTFPLFLMPSSVYKSFRWIYRRTWKKRLMKEQGLSA